METCRGRKEDTRLSVLEVGWLIALALVTTASYAHIIHHPFCVVDDSQYVTGNIIVRKGLSSEGIGWAFSSFFYGNWSPLTSLSHMLDVSIFGMWAGGHHLVNLMLHVLNTLIVFAVFFTATSRFFPGFLAASLFALHPVHVEPVVWISSRKDVLSGFFTVGTLLLYTLWTRKEAEKRLYALALVSFILALASKPPVLVLPAVLLVFDYWPLERSSRIAPGRLLLEKIPFFAIAAVFLALSIKAQTSDGGIQILDSKPLVERVIDAHVYYLHYMWSILFPFKLGLPYASPGGGVLLRTACFCLFWLIVLGVWKLRLRFPPAFAGFLFFLVMTAPYLQFAPVGLQVMSDRWMYLAAIGIFTAVSYTACLLIPARGSREIRAAVMGAALFCLSFLTHRQAFLWSDDRSLFRHTISVTGPNFLAHNYLAAAHSARDEYGQSLEEFKTSFGIQPFSMTFEKILSSLARDGRTSEAISFLHPPVRADVRFARLEYGAMLYAVSGPDAARDAYRRKWGRDSLEDAVREFDEVLAEDINNRTARALRALSNLRLKKYGPADSEFQEILRKFPQSSQALFGLGVLRYEQGKHGEAEHYLKKALVADPNYRHAANNLATLYQNTKRYDQAVEYADVAIQLEADDVDALEVRAVSLAALGRKMEALQAFDCVLKLAPRNFSALNGKGSVLYQSGRFLEAAVFFRSAMEIKPGIPVLYYNFGTALAKAGNIQEAVPVLQEAMRLDPSLQDEVSSILSSFGITTIFRTEAGR